MHVAARHGKMTIEGYIANNHDWQRVPDIAYRASGVSAVVNRLIVNTEKTNGNVEIARAISMSLRLQVANRDVSSIGISIVDQVAVIYGEARATWERNLVKDTIREFGIGQVYDRVQQPPV